MSFLDSLSLLKSFNSFIKTLEHSNIAHPSSILMASRSYTHSHHQTIISLNPAWCLRPISFRRGRSFREPSDDCTSNTCSSTTFSTTTTTHSRLLVADEPSSPKIGCMGQIRRGKACSEQHAKMFRFRRLLSGRGIPTPHSSAKVRDQDSHHPVNDISNIDPPLPVVRRGEKDANAAGLWRRRCRGPELEALELQKPQLVCAYQPSTAV